MTYPYGPWEELNRGESKYLMDGDQFALHYKEEENTVFTCKCNNGMGGGGGGGYGQQGYDQYGQNGG